MSTSAFVQGRYVPAVARQAQGRKPKGRPRFQPTGEQIDRAIHRICCVLSLSGGSYLLSGGPEVVHKELADYVRNVRGDLGANRGDVAVTIFSAVNKMEKMGMLSFEEDSDGRPLIVLSPEVMRTLPKKRVHDSRYVNRKDRWKKAKKDRAA